VNLRISAGVAALALGAALALTGCGSGDAADGASPSPSPSPSSAAATAAPTPTAEDVKALDAVKVTGKGGTEPTLKFSKPFSVSVPTTRVVAKGDGETLKTGLKVTIDYVSYQGDGTRLGSTWEQKQSESFILGDQSYGLLNDPLTGAKVGTRLLLANPTASQDGSTTTMISLIEVAGAKEVPARASGTAVKPADGLPKVTLADNGKPSIDIPKGYKAPAKLVAQPLIKGTGAKVTADQTVMAHYTGWTTDGKQFDSSWDRGTPSSFSLQQVIPGWTEGLAGQTIGSQVLLVIPADKGYGEQGSGSIPPNAPLVFVVDILDAE
jgi:peptidylprolyl isomerase